ncbi:MAG: D-alanyl-D-alanine carboxypeptidase/D-alanyl-D-alanine-endopeptidase [Muribaculaceae bacterium]
MILKTFSRQFATIIAVVTALNVAASENLSFENHESTTVGIFVKEIATGKVLVQENAMLSLTPASVTKTVTSATALLNLGTDFRFATTVALSGKRSTANPQRWEGDLVIYASGDPTIGSNEFDSTKYFSTPIIEGVKRLNITEITGGVVVVDTLRDAGPLPTWECEDIAWPYGAGFFGFNYCGNVVKVYPNRGITEQATHLKIVTTPTDERSYDVLRGINSNELLVKVPANQRGKATWAINATNPDPAYTYTKALAQKLRNAGIKINEKPVSEGVPEATTVVHINYSPTAAEICQSLMKRSDNLFAEGMLRAIDPEGSRKDCLKTLKDFWKDKGLRTSSIIMHDGSGLTRSNRFSPVFLAALLEHMAKSPLADTYVQCFPLAGIDGTLKNFGSRTILRGRIALKTGSLSSVQTYAGYHLDADHKPTHVIVVMVNGFTCPRRQVQAAIEKFLIDLFK